MSQQRKFIDNNIVKQMNDSEWARFICELVYVMWFNLFSISIERYGPHAHKLMGYARTLLQYI